MDTPLVSTPMKAAPIQRYAITAQKPSLTTALAPPMTFVVNAVETTAPVEAAPILQHAITTLRPLSTMDHVIKPIPRLGACSSEGTIATILSEQATSEPYTFEGTSNPEASSIDIVLNFIGTGFLTR